MQLRPRSPAGDRRRQRGVTGGPGGDPETPYAIAFTGAKADQDVKALSADGSLLSGDAPYAAVSTLVPGGPGTGEIGIFAVNVGALNSSGKVTVQLGPLPAGIVTDGEAEGISGWSCAAPKKPKSAAKANSPSSPAARRR